jgi:hypothetical protein
MGKEVIAGTHRCTTAISVQISARTSDATITSDNISAKMT